MQWIDGSTVIKPSQNPDFSDSFEADDDFTDRPAWSEPGAARLDDPFAAETLAADPFAPTASEPFATAATDPFAAPSPAFASAGSDPFATTASEPFGVDLYEADRVSTDDGFSAPDLDPALKPPPPSNPVGSLIAGAEAQLSHGVEASVPRIGVHIFCETPEAAQAAELAKADRRMAKSTTEIRTGGLSTAVATYQNSPTPSLVIVETHDPAPVLLSLLGQLAEVCDPGTKVIVIGKANDIALYRELMRQGVSEYLVPPLQPLQLIEAITNLYSDPSAPFVGRSIAFVGAKGGVGASTIAHNFAHVLTEHMQTNAVIVDFDLPFGTAGLDFNQDPLQGVADALSQPDRLDPVLLERMMARCTERLSLFAAPASLDDDYDIAPEAFEEVAAKIRSTAPFVIYDLPHQWSSWIRRMLLTSDEVVIVATPDLASLRNAKNIVDLVRNSRPNDAPPRLVLNQVGVAGRPEIPVKDFGDAIGLVPSLILPFEPKVFGQAANNGQMVGEVGGKTKVVEGLANLAQLITRREAPPALKKSLFASLFKGK